MQSAQESLAELRAAIRYCENAISAAESTIESMDFRQQLAKQQAMNKQESTGREEALAKRVRELEYDLTAKTAQAGAWKKEADELKNKVQGQYDDIVMLEREVELLQSTINALEQPEQPTMPVIPKAVAIAIFREGIKQGVDDACNELRGQTIEIRENEYVGDFEVSFSRELDLDDELDLDWVRDKVGQYEESFVVDALKGLCASKEFECRIHGIDDND